MGNPRVFFVLLSDGYFKVKNVVWGCDLVFFNQLVDPYKQKGLNFGVNSLIQINISVFVLFHELVSILWFAH